MKLSIIVPVYNAANHLSKCINSILEQSYSDFELILINDGSSDNSLEVLKRFEKTDSRIILLDKANSGVSDTRNLGILKAKGEYICFIDSDDWISEGYFEEFMKKKPQCDTLLIQNILRFNKPMKNLIYGTYVLKDDIEDFIVSNDIFYFGGPVAKFFNRQILLTKNIYFEKNISYGEDLIFFLKYLKYIQKVTILDIAKYNYAYNSGSLSTISHPFASHFNLHLEILDFIKFMNPRKKETKKYAFNVDWDFIECSMFQGALKASTNKQTNKQTNRQTAKT